MRLLSLSWEPRAQQFIAVTSEGTFLVPNVRGGWASRRVWTHSGVFKPLLDPQGTMVFLGMIQAPAPHVGGCNCLGRRR